jgi:hypothetical protein
MSTIKVAESVLTVDSLDELIKVAQDLLKPIDHVVTDKLDTYWTTDGITRYEYRVGSESR